MSVVHNFRVTETTDYGSTSTSRPTFVEAMRFATDSLAEWARQVSPFVPHQKSVVVYTTDQYGNVRVAARLRLSVDSSMF
jgi:hypothetical protein